jgi:hypothetical protein
MSGFEFHEKFCIGRKHIFLTTEVRFPMELISSINLCTLTITERKWTVPLDVISVDSHRCQRRRIVLMISLKVVETLNSLQIT